jgi:hypothetical protein
MNSCASAMSLSDRIHDLEEDVYALQRQMHDLLIWVKDLDTNVSALNRITTDLYINRSGGIPDTLGEIDGSNT